METKTIWFEGMGDVDIENFYPLKLLRKHYNIVITDKNPQYIFFSNYNNFSFCKYKGVRIFFNEEMYFPNLNISDYVVMACNDFLFRDRCCHWNPKITSDLYSERLKIRDYTLEDIQKKDKFCNYIYSHDRYNVRTEIFRKLSTYRQVDSAGFYLNNMGGLCAGDRSSYDYAAISLSKYNFQKKYKFSIAYENFSYPTYNSEKILDAFVAGTVPIYWGDPEISKIYNPKAFINAMDYESVEDLIEKIKEVDSNDDLYLSMLNQPVFNNERYIEMEQEQFETFLLNIFKQDYNLAFRRPKNLYPYFEDVELKMATPYLRSKNILVKPLKYILNPEMFFRRIKYYFSNIKKIDSHHNYLFGDTK